VIERTADFMSNGAFVAGADVPDWRSRDLVGIHVSLAFDDRIVVERNGGHPLADPLLPAVDLVNLLRATSGVRAGQVVTTGAYTGLHVAAPGQRITARFAGLPVVAVDVA
jgi:2-keto-4-pentenoate hydratase